MSEQSQAITRKSASNLALAFVLLPKEKREAMSVLYALCREIDDVADEESQPVEARQKGLALWRADVRRAWENKTPEMPVNRELQPVIQNYHLPWEYLDELLKGVEMDLTITRYANEADLEAYCYRVASVVGLLSIEIFGYQNPLSRDYAIYLGKALQLTNILRDVRTDAERGRIYLPLDLLERHGVKEEEILRLKYSERYLAAARELAKKARCFYGLAWKVLPPEDRRSMAAAELMGSVYWRLLRKLEHQKFNVFGAGRTRVGRTQKAALITRTWFRILTGMTAPNYGY